MSNRVSSPTPRYTRGSSVAVGQRATAFVDVDTATEIPYERRVDCPSWCEFHWWDVAVDRDPIFMGHDATITEGEGAEQVGLSLAWSADDPLGPHVDPQQYEWLAGQSLVNNARLYERAAELLARG